MGLEVSDLTVHVDTVRWSDDVVRGVDLTVGRGALTLLVGDSGSGKSMLARAISGAFSMPLSSGRNTCWNSTATTVTASTCGKKNTTR